MESPTTSGFSPNNNSLGNVNNKYSSSKRLWIFGYGSLCWNPGFKYEDSMIGYVNGFSRRFWQGNTAHRGTESKPGRVATLIEDIEGVTWGRAFLVPANDKAALPYLAGRECRLGGYIAQETPFHSRKKPCDQQEALVYIATPQNKLWLGAAPLPDIARQILECSGPSGHNAEYLLRLAAFIRDEAPEALDDHLFSLERLVRMFAFDMQVCLRSLLGETSPVSDTESENNADSNRPRLPAQNTFEFTSRLPEKKLRCLNM